MHDRSIMHMDLDTFFVSVERLLDSRLNNKPVLIGGTSDRGVVAACSYEARQFGIHSAMPMRMAKELCPEAITIRGNSGTYMKYSSMVTDIVAEHVPVYEKTSVDEFYCDLSGMDRFFGCMKFASELRQRIIHETGLPISFGLSQNKTVSKVATGEAKPNNELRIDKGTERPFLAPLSIRKVPMVGDKTYQTLRNLGIRQIRTVQDMPVDMMEQVLGQPGVGIWKKCNGIDNSPVLQYNERKSISTERTFDKDTIDVHKLRGILIAMTENLAYQLRRGEKLSACVTLKIRYSDFNTYTLQRRVPYTSADRSVHRLVVHHPYFCIHAGYCALDRIQALFQKVLDVVVDNDNGKFHPRGSAFSYGTRWAIERPRVTSSAYSNSPPTDTPRAMVVTDTSKGASLR